MVYQSCQLATFFLNEKTHQINNQRASTKETTRTFFLTTVPPAEGWMGVQDPAYTSLMEGGGGFPRDGEGKGATCQWLFFAALVLAVESK
jgi:hypothetical protein